MSTDSLRIEEVTDLQLVPELARLTDLAFQSDGFYAFANTYRSKSIYEETIDRLTAAVKDPQSHIFRAMWTTHGEDGATAEQLVGLTQWYIGYLVVPKVDPFAPKVSVSGPGNVSDALEAASVGANRELSTVQRATKIKSGKTPNPFDSVAIELGNSQVRAIRGKRHIYLRRMIVHPDFQRKGIGQRLLQWGVDLADRENIVCWLFSRPAGSKLYEKNGWRAVDSIAVDVPGMEVAPFVSMLRKPQPR